MNRAIARWFMRAGSADEVADAVVAELAAALGRRPDGRTLREA